MKTIVAVLIASAVAVSCGGEGGEGFGRRAVDLVEAMDDGRYDDVREALHERLSANLTKERLGGAWQDFIDDHGEIISIGSPEVVEDNGTLVTIALDMSKRDGRALVRFLPGGEVVGLDFGDPEEASR